MAGVDVRISELPAATEGHADDRFETTQVDGATLVSRSITLDQVSDAVAAILPPASTAWDDITGKPATFPATLPAGAIGYGATSNTLTGVAADLAWDATNKRLGIGIAAPAYKVQVQQSGGDILTVDNSGIVGTAGAVRALLPFAWQAGGQWWSSITIGTTSGGYLGLYAGTGVPTASTFGAYGTLYVNGASPGIPYYNNNGGTGWDQLVGLSATQTLTNKTFAPASISPGSNTQVLTTVAGVAAWAAAAAGGGSGTVTSTSVVSANGLAGTVATATTTPAITLSTTITGVLKGNGTAISAATAGTDYMTPGNVSAAYQPLDAELTALAGLNATAGLVEQTAAAAFTKRLIGVANATDVPTRANADARYAPISVNGTVTSTSVVSANGLAGTVATATTTPAITLSTTITGLLKGNGTAISAATAGTDYITPATNSVLQTVFVETGAVATGTTVVPADDTIPQITEGDQYMTLAITPKSATSKLVIDVNFIGSVSILTNLIVALFQDAVANALAVSVTATGAGSLATLSLRHTMTSGTTSATTFRVRAGGSGASTTTFNGTGGARFFGGALASSIVIQEVA